MAFDLHPILDKDVSPRPGLWYAVAPDGAPAARVGATAIQARDVGSAFLCAGAAPEGAFSDLHELKIDSESISWKSLPSLSLPPRYEHTLAISRDGDLMVFAGAQESGPLGDMWAYDRDSGEWQVVEGVSGDPPAPRTHHSSTCVWRDKIVVFSGGDSGTDTLDECLYLFDMASHTWQHPEATGSPPSPRQGHISAVVGDTLYIHGGMVAGGDIYSDLYTLDLVKMHWTRPQLSGTAPPPSAAHGCAIIGTRLYIFGGLTPGGASDTLHCLDTESLTWDLASVKGAPPPSRLDHAMTTIRLNRPPPSLNGSDRDTSPLSQLPPVTTPTTSHPHLVTVISPETMDSETETTINGSGNAQEIEPGIASAAERNSVDETCDSTDQASPDQAQSEGVDPSLNRTSEVATVAGKERASDTAALEKHRHSQCSGSETVEALLVFGGMDTSGHIHNDCFVIVPP